jgi:hypothetical protein
VAPKPKLPPPFGDNPVSEPEFESEPVDGPEESEPATANPEAESGLPEASDAAMITVAGDVEVPPITNAFCTILLAVRLAPALTTVSPVPVIAPTC